MILNCHMISQGYVTKGWSNIMGRKPNNKGPCQVCQVQWPQALCQWKYNDFRLSGDLTRQCNQSLMSLYGQKPIKVSYHPAKFDDQKQYVSRNTMILVCYVISQGHVTKWSCNLLVKICCGSEDITVIVFQVISQDHVIKRPCQLMCRSPSR